MLDFREGPFEGQSFQAKLRKMKVKSIQEMLTIIEPYMILEEKIFEALITLPQSILTPIAQP